MSRKSKGKHCLKCGQRVYRVVSPGGYHFWVTTDDGKAVCRP